VHAVMNLWALLNVGNFLTSQKPVGISGRVCSMELVTLLNNRMGFAVHNTHKLKFYCCCY